ncbi:MAG: poly(R)-hydroxyalkanoic acid synthase subunit PhaE [Peptoniphilus sp.]|nr:poly(R)-hydroxyalkanoic acid synthase subunit PhaE [Peptoniphilus sp.]MDY6045142.1 poly(R)-hydroxyalkanoic acid synthase subunit PhaE [Peptoniphilus sp.]
MATNYDVWNEMFKAGQNMMDAWMKALPKRDSEGEKESVGGFDFSKYQDWMNFQQSWLKNWQDMMNIENPWGEGPYAAWARMVNAYNPFKMSKDMSASTREVFEKMLNSNQMYLGMYEQWKKFSDNFLKPGTEEYKKNLDQLVDQFNKMFMDHFIPLLPENLRGLMINTQSYFNTYIDTLENFIGPWSWAYQNIADIYMESIYKDPMKLADTLKEWKEAYDQTFGVLVKSPVVGSSREMLEQNNKAVGAMIDMLVAVSEFMTRSLSVGYEYSKEAFEDYFDSIEEGEEPKTFNEFYKMWSKHVENALETYFYTDEFSKLIAKVADSTMIFKIEYDKVLEKALKNSPIVTKSEVDNVYKNVYELRREVRALKKELENVKASKDDSSETK